MLPSHRSVRTYSQHVSHRVFQVRSVTWPSVRIRGFSRPLEHARQHSRCCQAVAEAFELASVPDFLPIAAAAVPLTGVIGLAIWKLVLYSQIEYVTAAMLSNYVPRDGPGARVIQLCGSTRELYYYPKNTVQVTVVGERVNKGLLEQAGMQAGVPVVARPQSPCNLGFQPDRSADAVVAIGSIASISSNQLNMFITEVLRVLKPGCPLIFVEKLKDDAFPLRSVVGSTGPPLGLDVLEGLKQRPGFELVKWDIACPGQDPHAVGVAIKASSSAKDAAPVSNKGMPAGNSRKPSRK